MKHNDCVNYIHLDCEKGMCQLSKAYVFIDGEGSEACGAFEAAPKCGNCKNFSNPDKYKIGTCSGFAREDWTYASCDAYTCEHYVG